MEECSQQELTESSVRPDSAGTLGELLRVAIPLMISTGSLSVMGIIDRLLLTGLSPDALCASMPAGMLHWTILSVPFGIATYVNTFVAQHDGAKQKDRVAACVWQGIWISLLAGCVIFALIPLVQMLIPLNGHPPAVQQLESEYYSILAMGSAPMLISNVFSAFFAGRGQTVTVMSVNLAAMLTNAILDAVLIFGFGPIPQLGMAGAAWATVLANVTSCIVFGVLTARAARVQQYPFSTEMQWDTKLIWRMLSYGFPNGIQMLTDAAAFLIFILATGILGQHELEATNLAFNLNSMAFIPLIGMGTAVMSLVGRRIGEGRPDLAVRTTWLAMGTSGLYMLFFCVLFLGIPNALIAPYAAFAKYSDRPDDFAEIVPLVVTLLRFVAVYSIFDAMVIVFGNAIRGAGDVRFSIIATTTISWTVMVVPCVAIILWFPSLGLNGCWAAATAHLILAGLVLFWRFRQGHWRSMKVID
ncbi:MAG: MATE family efflux transporter [Planctomycetaceae bacterium]|nr:MATE family efflux transporter [Planctomycetaceae bacterium]